MAHPPRQHYPSGPGICLSIATVSDDVICRIVSGELDAAMVYRDERLIAFLDHRPVFKGHLLIAPIEHVDNLFTLRDDLMQPLLKLAQQMSEAMRDALGAQGSFSAINTVVSQSIPHLHLHVVPRSRRDGLRGFFWPRTHYADGEAVEYAARLAAAAGLDD